MVSAETGSLLFSNRCWGLTVSKVVDDQSVSAGYCEPEE